MKNIANLLNRDILEVVCVWYCNLDKRYKIAFFVALVANIISFFFFIAHQPLHNHGMRMPWVDPSHQNGFGRWFSYVLIISFNSSNLPVILPLVSIVLHILSGMFTCLVWDKRSSAIKLTVVTLLVSLYPAFLSTFYYTYMSQLFSFSIFFAALALYVGSSFTWKRIISSSLLIMLAMATYQISLSVFLTIFMSLTIIKMMEFEGSYLYFIVTLKDNIFPRFLAIITGVILYRVSLVVLDINMNSHATRTIDFSDFWCVWARVVVVVKASFNHLHYTQPEFLIPLKMTLLLIVISSFLLLLSKCFMKKWVFVRFLAVCFLFSGTIVATKALYLLSPNESLYIYRYNLSLGYFYAFCFFVLISYVNNAFLKNIVMLLSIFVVIKYSYADLVRQHVILRAQQHDLAIANRILSRIETLPEIDFNKKYSLIRIGKYSNFRNFLLRSKKHHYKIAGGGHMDVGDISDVWCPADVMRLLGSKVQWKYYGYDPFFREKIKYAKEYLVKERQRWPHKDSIFIHEDTVYVYMQ